VRSGSWGEVELLARAWADVLGRDAAAIDDLVDFARAAPPASLFPEPLLRSDDLAEARVERGPRWGQLLARAEELQLDGRLASRADALEWLREAARESE
jgi:poly(A) polymerase